MQRDRERARERERESGRELCSAGDAHRIIRAKHRSMRRTRTGSKSSKKKNGMQKKMACRSMETRRRCSKRRARRSSIWPEAMRSRVNTSALPEPRS